MKRELRSVFIITITIITSNLVRRLQIERERITFQKSHIAYSQRTNQEYDKFKIEL